MKEKNTDARDEHPLIASDIQLLSTVFADHVYAFLQVFLDVTLPEPQDKPAPISQFVIDFLVSLNIPLQLLLPVFLIGTNLFSRVLLMPFGMPEITINKNSDVVPGDGNVRGTWKHLVILSVAQAPVPERFAKKEFRLSVLGPYMAHVLMTLLFSQDIHTESSQIQTFNIHLSVSQVITIYLGSGYLSDLNILKM